MYEYVLTQNAIIGGVLHRRGARFKEIPEGLEKSVVRVFSNPIAHDEQDEESE